MLRTQQERDIPSRLVDVVVRERAVAEGESEVDHRVSDREENGSGHFGAVGGVKAEHGRGQLVE